MLVFTMLPTQQAHIGNDIVVVVLSVRGDRVQIGFDAPREVPIHRAKVFAELQEEKRMTIRPRR